MRKKKVSQREYIRRLNQSKKACGVTLHEPEPSYRTDTFIEMTPNGKRSYRVDELDTSSW
jgi:hypothetical protein